MGQRDLECIVTNDDYFDPTFKHGGTPLCAALKGMGFSRFGYRVSI